MNIQLDAFICYTELVPDCALGEAFEYDRSTNILLLERVYAGGPALDAAMLCFGNRLVGVNEASIPYNRNILSSFAAGSYALEYNHCGRQVAKYRCGMMDSEIAEFASVCRTASLTTAADEYDRGGYALSPVPTAWPGDVVWAKYYDDYRFVAVRGLGTDFAFEASASAPFYASATGLLTGMYTGSGYEAYYYDSEGREVQRYATGYNRGRRCTAYNYDGTIASRTYSYKESYLPDMEEVYAYDSCGRLTSTTIRVDKAVPVLNPAAGQDAADSEATDAASPAASSLWATAVIRREYDAIGRLARLRHGDAAVTEYSYDVHSWPVSQQTTYGAAANTSSIGYTLEYAPCYNGNISKRTWDEGDYAYSYDALNRLESAVFTPAEGLADRPGIERDRIPDFSVYYSYDLRGNTTNVVRYGVVDAISDLDRIETFGTLDELSCAYDGNRLSNVTAITDALPFDGVTGLHADGEFELAYNDAGDMVSDASRGLLYTRWNADGHPMQYDLEGGHRQLLGWDAFGNHLYTSYETSVAPVSVGSLPGRTRRTSLRAYSGDGHILRGGAGNSAADTLEMLRFAGGYFDADLVPHYYVTDYLGSNIAVIRSDGALVQSATYYPYGTPHRAPKNLTAVSTTNSYLFGGKELMTQDALDEYLYGARTYLPAATIFSSIDPLCEKYYHLSPYVFCAANPIRYVDPSGARIFLSQDMNLKQIFTVLLDLQRLTDDKLVYQTQSDGRRMIKIAKLGKGKHTAGTNLIRRLNTSSKNVTITYDQLSKEKTNTFRHKAINVNNATNGTGSDAKVNYSSTQKVDVTTSNAAGRQPTKQMTPSHICIAHELIHSLHSIDGTLSKEPKENYLYFFQGMPIKVDATPEELRTVGLLYVFPGDITENDIRREQQLGYRLNYGEQ